MGRPLDPITGWWDFRARHLDSRLGRFTTPDPLGYPDGHGNLYAAFLADPVNNSDPMGLAVGDWWDPRNLDGQFWGGTGYQLWDVASLGTLAHVNQGRGLDYAPGWGTSTRIARDRIGNVGTFGLQDNLVTAAEYDGDLTGRDVEMAVSKTAYDLTPMEEVRAIAQEGDTMDAADLTRSVFTGIAKTASLGAVSAGGARGYSAYRSTGSVAATLAMRRAQISTSRAATTLGDLGESALQEVAGPGGAKTWLKAGRLGRREVDYLANEVGHESKNVHLTPSSRLSAQIAKDAALGTTSAMAGGARWHLWRGAAGSVLDQLTAVGIPYVDYAPYASAWHVVHPRSTVFLRMPQEAGQPPR